MRFRFKRVCSSAWLERTPDKGEVGGSSPPRPTNSIYILLVKMNVGILWRQSSIIIFLEY